MQNSFIIHAQYVKDFSFENPKAPESFKMEEAPEFNVSLDIKVNQFEEKTFEVILCVEIKAESKKESVFVTSLEYAGIFTIENIEKEELEKTLMVQCPHYLFPYLRQIVSDIVQKGGYMPLNLHPVDFMGLYIQKTQSANQQDSAAN
jgi:preprotein translocase subunit SecB